MIKILKNEILLYARYNVDLVSICRWMCGTFNNHDKSWSFSRLQLHRVAKLDELYGFNFEDLEEKIEQESFKDELTGHYQSGDYL